MICMISILRLLGTRLHSNTCLSDLGYFRRCVWDANMVEAMAFAGTLGYFCAN